MLPVSLSAQNYGLPKDEKTGKVNYTKIYNVYNRTQTTVLGYAVKYLQHLKVDDNSITIDTASGTASTWLTWSYKGLNTTCKGRYKLKVHLIISAKDNKTRIEMTDILYSAENSKCPNSGTLEELLACDGCKMSFYLRERLSNNMYQTAQKYHSKLKSYVTEGPGDW